MNELHIERSLQFFKKNAIGKEEPEKIAVQRLLDRYYIEEQGIEMANSDTTQVPQNPTSPSPISEEDSLANPQDKVKKNQMKYIKSFCDFYNVTGHCSDHTVCKVAHLHRGGMLEKVTSLLYKRERTRHSSTVLVDVSSLGSPNAIGIGIVRFFFSLQVDGTEKKGAAIQMFRDENVVIHPDIDCGTIIEIKIDQNDQRKSIQCFPLEKVLTKGICLDCSYLGDKGKVTKTRQVTYSNFVVPKSQKWLKQFEEA